MSVIAQAKGHFETQPVRTIEVPEWGTGGKPLVVYYKQLSVAERRKCWRNSAGDLVDGTLACVRAVLFQARDAKRARLFDDMDEHALTYEVDSDVVSRIGAAILGFGEKGAPKTAQDEIDAAKNV